MLTKIDTQHGELQLPAFLPDGTRAIVKSIDSTDLTATKTRALVVNTLHLSSKPGITTLNQHGGVHNFMNWQKPIISDSGGFQVFSMITESKMGSITPNGFIYQLDKSKKKVKFTPEKCIRTQFQIGADVIYCLDYCTHPEMDYKTQKKSVELTIKWAKQCKKEYENQIKIRKKSNYKPLLFGVVQGGNYKDLRKQCANELLEIGFDGFGFGGWPINEDGKLVEMVDYVARIIPEDFPKHALGIGKPESLLSAYKSGYNIFDCVIPTRDARHKRLYVFNPEVYTTKILQGEFYHYIYLQDDIHFKNTRAIDENCDCHTCQNYSKSYLHHLFRINDNLAYRLATIHNLRFYSKLVELLTTL